MSSEITNKILEKVLVINKEEYDQMREDIEYLVNNIVANNYDWEDCTEKVLPDKVLEIAERYGVEI